MQREIETKILELLDKHRIMTIATLRPDGWPQATTVGYLNEDMTLYFLCSPESQKAANLAGDDRVSLTIDDDTPDITKISGLSMAARAKRVTDVGMVQRILALMPAKYPDQPELQIEMPKPEDIAIYRVTPMVISVLDYSKGFGHTDLVTL